MGKSRKAAPLGEDLGREEQGLAPEAEADIAPAAPAEPEAPKWCATCVRVLQAPDGSGLEDGQLVHGSRLFCAEAVRAGWAEPADQPLNDDAPDAPAVEDTRTDDETPA